MSDAKRLLSLSAEARAEFKQEYARMLEEQDAHIDASVDEWMKNEANVENALLKAVQEVSADMALLIAGANKAHSVAEKLAYMDNAMGLLLAQIKKEIREDVQEHIYG